MQSKTDPRHLRRRKIVQDLYSWAFNPQSPSKNISPIIEKIELIDKEISVLAPELPLPRINPLDLAILRLAIFELKYGPKVPVKAIIDEAIELAKEFGGEQSPKFINGALAQAIE
jgi:N utilization substance protein B